MADDEQEILDKEVNDVLDDDIPINPEGYGIEGAFEAVAVFEAHDTTTEDMSNDLSEWTVEGESGEFHEGELDEFTGEEGYEGEGGEEGYEYAGGYTGQEDEEEEQEEEEGEEAEIDKTSEAQPPEVKLGGLKELDEAKETNKEVYRRRVGIRQRFNREDAEEKRISGDFTAYVPTWLLITKDSSIQSFQSAGRESIAVIEEEDLPPIDREEYYDVYRNLSPEHEIQKMKNNFLQRKMADYFKKRKMEHVLKETDSAVDSQSKYDRKLDQYAELIDMDSRERANTSWELDDLRTTRDEQLELLNEHFHAMQQREKDIGTGLINTKTGKEIPEKLVDRFIKRQLNKSEEVATLRLVHIKVRNRIAEKKAILRRMDCFGDNLHLIDYEQLKMINQSDTDKIEERDIEMAKLRITCKTEIQCLAHVREKSAALFIDIRKMNERYEYVQRSYMDCRERLNYFTMERDSYRFEIERLKKEAGLLCKPNLCSDKEATMEELRTIKKEFERLTSKNLEMKSELTAIKRRINEGAVKYKSTKSIPTVKPSVQRVYKGRPTLIYPELPESEWSYSFKHF